jgi:glutathione S-transferase
MIVPETTSRSIVLIEHPLSPYAQKIRIFLREKHLPFDLASPQAGGPGRDGFAAFNPRAEVPMLVHGDLRLYDSTVILEYLEETFPDPPLMPATPAARARSRTIEDVCDTHWEAINWGLSEVRFFGRGGDALGPTLQANGLTQAGQMQQWLTGELGQGPWLEGAAFGWADMTALPYVSMSAFFGAPPPAGSPLADWLVRGSERASVAQTFAEAMATIPAMEKIGGLFAAGGRRRQFRDHRLEWMIRSGGIDVVVDGLEKDDIRFTDLSRFAASAALEA